MWKKIPTWTTLKIDGSNDGFKATLQIATKGEPLSTETSGNLPQTFWSINIINVGNDI